MAETDTIKEFLVALGFKIDEHGGKKFNEYLNQTTKNALKAGGSIVAVATAVELFTHKMNESIESLYFLSQRSGAAIANIQASAYAATQLGSSFGDVAASLETMGEMLRYNPGAEGYLNSLKVQTRDTNGALLDTTKIMSNLGKELAKQPPYLQKAYADYFHISDTLLRSLVSGDYDKLAADHVQRLKDAGVNMAALGEQSRIYETQWRKLIDDVEIFGDKLLQVTNGPALGLLSVLDAMAQAASHPRTSLHNLGEAVGDSLLLPSHTPKNLNPLSMLWDTFTAAGRLADLESNSKGAGVGHAASMNDPGTPAGRQQYALAQLTGMGLSNVQAAAMVAEFKQESGLNPNTKPGDSGTAFGIEQLRGDRLNLFRQHMGKDVQHSSLDEQLRYAVWELQNGDPQTRAAGDRFLHSTNIGEAVRAFTGVERPADTAKRNYLASDDAAGILRNMPTAAVINQTTNITVNGSTEPGKTADEIARRQSQVNQAVTRNVAGAVQ